MNFTHYTDCPVMLDRSRIYDQRGQYHGHGKPDGLWLSVDGNMDWPEWCLGEDFRLNALAWPYRVTLCPSPDVLLVTNGLGLESLHASYSYEDAFSRHCRSNPIFSDEYRRNQWPMDWHKLAIDYQGLIIAPYLWSHRYGGPFWYYGWDCASACIWDLSVIDTFELRYVPQLEAGK